MPSRTKLGAVQQAIVDHVKGLEPKARATTEDLARAIRKATGKAASKTSLFGAVHSLRKRGLVTVGKVGRELRVGAASATAVAKGGAKRAAGTALTTAAKAERRARVAVGKKLVTAGEVLAHEGASAQAAAAHAGSVIGTKLAPGESVVLHVERDVVHVLENVHGRVEHRKVHRTG